MFEYLKGQLAEITPTYAVIDIGGLGYLVQLSAHTYAALQGQKEAHLYLHQILREDTNTLFGFHTKQERELFRLLISVSGVGANTARMILSAYDPNELIAIIQSGNDAPLRQVKGIGAKTAQRVIVDLREKVATLATTGEAIAPSEAYTAQAEALAALLALGFPRPVSEKVLRSIATQESNPTVEQLIKLALKQL